jgi:hypothetical protein
MGSLVLCITILIKYFISSRFVDARVYFLYIFGRLECDGHFFAYGAHFVFLRDVWIRT